MRKYTHEHLYESIMRDDYPPIQDNMVIWEDGLGWYLLIFWEGLC